MQGVRGVCNRIFLFVLLSCVIFPMVFADETANNHDPANSYELVNETINPSVNSSIITTTDPISTETIVTATETSEPLPEITGNSQASAVSITKSSDGRKYLSDQVIVRYNSKQFPNADVMSTYTAKSNAKIGAHVHKDFSSAGLSGMQVVTLPENISVDEAIAEYQKNPDVLYAEPNYVYQISAITPNDPYYSNYLWGLHNTGQTIGGSVGTADADIDAPEAWGISTGSNNVVVAVIDTGVNYNHPDLAANIWINPGEIAGNHIDDDLNGYIDDIHGWNFITNTSDPFDDNGHGTHVSGTIGAVGNNNIGVTGVNWNTKIMALKFLDASGSGYTDRAVTAILYANANGAAVISNSWGGYGDSQSIKDAIDASPAVVVCAAGNDGISTDTYPHYPSSYTSANIISVAATDNKDQLASFSNYGPKNVSLAAPGVNILSTLNVSGTYTYSYKSGTSMATPHVSGVAALVKSVNPGLTNIQIKNIILNNVDVKSSLFGKVNTSGRLNAYKAMQAVRATVIPVADFSALPSEGMAPVTVQFTDLSSNTPTSWNWTFGDGNRTGSNLQNPVHTYFTKGNFTVNLNATNSWGSNISTKVQYINVTVIPPVADFSGTPVDGRAPLTVQFTDLSANAPTSWNWTFGDGTLTNATFQNPVHKYAIAGSYSVSLNATNTEGSDIMTKSYYVNVLPPLPVADFIGTPVTGVAPLTVTFSDLSINEPDTWNWTFGDGETTNATERNPVHTYFTTGSYNVSLNVTNTEGFNNSTKIRYIIVTEFPTTKIAVNRNGAWYLDYNGNGVWDGTVIDRNDNFGGPGNRSVAGDWDGDGRTEIGVTNGIDWYLDNNGNGVWDGPAIDNKSYFGITGYTPVVGDWDGNGKTKIGVTNGINWFIDTNGNGVWDGTPTDQYGYFGIAGYTPVVGDWDGNGKTKIGVTNGINWFIDTNGNGVWDGTPTDQYGYFGIAGYTPVVGDWDGNGKTKIGVTNGINWFIDTNGNGVWDGTPTDQYGYFGIAGYTPVVGDWDGNGKTKIGVTNSVNWYLDNNGNGVWDGPAIDKAPYFGIANYAPIIGKW
jgi:thermitase